MSRSIRQLEKFDRIVTDESGTSVARFTTIVPSGWGDTAKLVKNEFFLSTDQLLVRVGKLAESNTPHHPAYKANAMYEFSKALYAFQPGGPIFVNGLRL